MAGVRTAKGGGIDAAPFQKLLYTVVVIIACALGLPILWKLLRKFIQSEEDAQADEVAENPVKLKTAMDLAYEAYAPLAQPKEVYQNAAKTIFEAFNIPKHWYNWFLPTSWFEDDETAFNALMSSSGAITGAEHEYLSVCYMLISGSDRRDLTRDIFKYLDGKYEPYLVNLH